MMTECKAMEVKLDDEVLQQVLLYSFLIPVHYFVITNGAYTYCNEKETNSLVLQTLFAGFYHEGGNRINLSVFYC
jgi:hypothetical protein